MSKWRRVYNPHKNVYSENKQRHHSLPPVRRLFDICWHLLDFVSCTSYLVLKYDDHLKISVSNILTKLKCYLRRKLFGKKWLHFDFCLPFRYQFVHLLVFFMPLPSWWHSCRCQQKFHCIKFGLPIYWTIGISLKRPYYLLLPTQFWLYSSFCRTAF